MRSKVGIFLIAQLLSLEAIGQTGAELCDDTLFCQPFLEGMARPKGVIFQYESILNFEVSPKSNTATSISSNGKANKNRRIDFKMKLPILNHPGFKLVGGFNYVHEEFRFNDNVTSENSLSFNLEDKHMKSFGVSLYGLKPFKGRSFLVIRFGASQNGDFSHSYDFTDYLKFSFTPLYGWKINSKLMLGVGAGYSSTFGNSSFYPILLYNQTFNDFWGIESIVPGRIRFRFNFSEKTILYAGAEATDKSYKIQFYDVSSVALKDLYLRKSDVRYQLNLDREIHDWLWFGVTVGMRESLGFSISESNSFSSGEVVNAELGQAFFFNLNLFIVPPKKWHKKKKK